MGPIGLIFLIGFFLKLSLSVRSKVKLLLTVWLLILENWFSSINCV